MLDEAGYGILFHIAHMLVAWYIALPPRREGSGQNPICVIDTRNPKRPSRMLFIYQAKAGRLAASAYAASVQYEQNRPPYIVIGLSALKEANLVFMDHGTDDGVQFLG